MISVYAYNCQRLGSPLISVSPGFALKYIEELCMLAENNVTQINFFCSLVGLAMRTEVGFDLRQFC